MTNSATVERRERCHATKVLPERGGLVVRCQYPAGHAGPGHYACVRHNGACVPGTWTDKGDRA